MRSNKINFHAHLTHCSYEILATDKTAMRTPEQGVIMLVNPSPNWKASTVACREIPIMSENGAMMGIVTAAFAEADGMNRLINVCIPYIVANAPSRPLFSRAFAMDVRRVFITAPSSSMTIMPAAKPMMRAARTPQS